MAFEFKSTKNNILDQYESVAGGSYENFTKDGNPVTDAILSQHATYDILYPNYAQFSFFVDFDGNGAPFNECLADLPLVPGRYPSTWDTVSNDPVILSKGECIIWDDGNDYRISRAYIVHYGGVIQVRLISDSSIKTRKLYGKFRYYLD